MQQQLERKAERRRRLCRGCATGKNPFVQRQVSGLKQACRYTSAEEMYKDLFGLESIDTPSENELRLQYSKPVPYTVSLVFNPTTKQLADAKVRIPVGSIGC